MLELALNDLDHYFRSRNRLISHHSHPPFAVIEEIVWLLCYYLYSSTVNYLFINILLVRFTWTSTNFLSFTMIISISFTVLPFCPSFQFFLHGMLMHQSHNNSARNMIHLHCTCECVYKRQRTSGLSWDKRQESVVRSIWKSLLITSVRASRVARSLEYKIYV